ncbi:signal peptidase I [Actinoallomurus iriomotensis]|uniref:signal peptidase I n=1 Tax=Actinoallomurus iriomotensis TaxID=478107 RepID=UPI002557BEA7|nr:signal peptidase I [Actinoallomurus iriomotensis]
MRNRVIAMATLLWLVTGCAPASAALHGYHRYTNPSVAMEPTLRANQPFSARPVRHGGYVPKRGDVVVFTMPSWTPDGRGTQPFVKRVVAIAGDRIGCCSGGRITLNGTPLAEPYLAPDTSETAFGTVAIPPGQMWLMGDNRAYSADSRAGHGPVPASAVIGVAVLR